MYELRYLTLVNSQWRYVNLSHTDTTYTIAGLSFDTKYAIQLRFKNDAGFGPMSTDFAKTHGTKLRNLL